jgi:hypothetical protein
MEEFLHETLRLSPACRIFSVRRTREIILVHGHGHYCLAKDRFDHYYWRTDWNGYGYL